jgi:hypothetical protein
MPDIRSAILAAVLAMGTGALGSWWLTFTYKDTRHNAAMATLKAEASTALADATQRVLDVQRRNQDLANNLEVTHAKNRNNLDQALADNRRLARELGGLRDPGAQPGGGCTVPSASDTTGQPDGAATPGRLSDQASDFLLEFARQADRAAEYAQLCHAWIKELKH